jgi:hypothetical protein
MRPIYRRLNEYLKEKFHQRTLKICIDGGFTCPNRDGSKGLGGCIFCSSKGSGENLHSTLSIREQVEQYLASNRSKRADAYLVYFQNFSSTYASCEVLKSKYDEALISPKIVGIDIDTRCDCINEEICSLLATYQDKYYVFVELGLQTSNEKTHILDNQQITNENFINAVKLLNKYHIDVVVHLMVGLPNESHQDVVNTINFLQGINYQGIKIHSTYVLKNTKLNELYQNGFYQPLELEEYIDECIYILTHINPDVVIHRISGDPPKDQLVAPLWASHKKWVMNGINNKMEKMNLYQGMYYHQDDKMIK